MVERVRSNFFLPIVEAKIISREGIADYNKMESALNGISKSVQMQASGASRTIKALFPVLPRKNEITLRAFKNGPGRVEATFEKDRNAIYKIGRAHV